MKYKYFITDQELSDTEDCITVLLRKEVIQPHRPIRLPCYDFTPIIGPTFGSALHYWLNY
jgi:hypothetical protein